MAQDSIEDVEHEFHKQTLDELQHQRSTLRLRVQHLQNEISNLAFNNYRTYADVGRTAEHCKEMFTEINNHMVMLTHDFPKLLESVDDFRLCDAKIGNEYSSIESINAMNSYVWELLKLPKLMDKCIREGNYEMAFALTNFAVNLKQSKLMQNAMIKEVVEVLIEARYGLLDELFNKFTGPIDLAKSIQVVNNIRKIPYISNTQLRVSILQFRDVYLEKNVLSIMSEPDFIFRIIEVYRDSMYDTIVLYLAVFPVCADFHQKYAVSGGSDGSLRWERWMGSSQMFFLQSWAHRNVERLFSFIRSMESKSVLDLETIANKLMSFAFSFGRMGLDFRSLIVHEFSKLIVDGFRKRISEAVKSLIGLKRIDLIDGDIVDATLNDLGDVHLTNSDEPNILSAPLELCVWDDICVFGNQIIEALNDTRHSLAITCINSMFNVLKCALHDLFKWVDCFVKDFEDTSRRAIHLLFTYFVPFIDRCFFNCFSYEKCCRQAIRRRLTLENYKETYSLLKTNLFDECNNSAFFRDIFDQVTHEGSSSSSAISSVAKSVSPVILYAESELADENNMVKIVRANDNVGGGQINESLSLDNFKVVVEEEKKEKRRMSLTDLVDEEINTWKVCTVNSAENDDALVLKKAD